MGVQIGALRVFPGQIFSRGSVFPKLRVGKGFGKEDPQVIGGTARRSVGKKVVSPSGGFISPGGDQRLSHQKKGFWGGKNLGERGGRPP